MTRLLRRLGRTAASVRARLTPEREPDEIRSFRRRAERTRRRALRGDRFWDVVPLGDGRLS